MTGEFAEYLNFCRSLNFDDRPDYAYLRHTFRSLFNREGFIYDCVFDWNLLKFTGSPAVAAAAAVAAVSASAIQSQHQQQSQQHNQHPPQQSPTVAIATQGSSQVPISTSQGHHVIAPLISTNNCSDIGLPPLQQQHQHSGGPSSRSYNQYASEGVADSVTRGLSGRRRVASARAEAIQSASPSQVPQSHQHQLLSQIQPTPLQQLPCGGTSSGHISYSQNIGLGMLPAQPTCSAPPGHPLTSSGVSLGHLSHPVLPPAPLPSVLQPVSAASHQPGIGGMMLQYSTPIHSHHHSHQPGQQSQQQPSSITAAVVSANAAVRQSATPQPGLIVGPGGYMAGALQSVVSRTLGAPVPGPSIGGVYLASGQSSATATSSAAGYTPPMITSETAFYQQQQLPQHALQMQSQPLQPPIPSLHQRQTLHLHSNQLTALAPQSAATLSCHPVGGHILDPISSSHQVNSHHHQPHQPFRPGSQHTGFSPTGAASSPPIPLVSAPHISAQSHSLGTTHAVPATAPAPSSGLPSSQGQQTQVVLSAGYALMSAPSVPHYLSSQSQMAGVHIHPADSHQHQHLLSHQHQHQKLHQAHLHQQHHYQQQMQQTQPQ
ncbi:unnamed protein product [Protopolystoma xenopodis]|uniref:Uncharacterized protein n=1 Tax=Protopolystoma xenopodis TaxID=117903 RepID=A0A448WIU3_9PLAT|nr:unnamed protein product [Protopolystoma xenopodis]